MMSRSSSATQQWIRGAVIAAAMLVMALGASAAQPAGVSYATRQVLGSTVRLITVDLDDPSLLVTAAVPKAPRRAQTFDAFMEEHKPLAQVTGSFFDMHSGRSIGDLVVRGELQPSRMRLGSALAIAPDNTATIVDRKPVGGWAGYESVLQGGVRLVRDGAFAVDARAQGFRDTGMARRTAHIAVGLLSPRRLVMAVAHRATLDQTARIMQAIGSTDAMALDGGGSTGIAYNGKTITSTPRLLSNVLMVVRRDPSRYAVRETPPIAEPAAAVPEPRPAPPTVWQRLAAFWQTLLDAPRAVVAGIRHALGYA